MKKRKLLLASLALCLAAILAVGSMAYFTATKEATHKFMTTSYDPDDPDKPIDPDTLFSIKLFEHDKDGNETEAGLEYKDISPASIVDKDPTVRNTGDYTAWVRMNVTITKATAWKAIMAKHSITDLADALFVGIDTATWDKGAITEDTAKDTVSMVYYLKAELVKDATSTLFTNVNIPAVLDAIDMVSIKTFDVKLTADAIQRANTGDTAQDAFTNHWGK